MRELFNRKVRDFQLAFYFRQIRRNDNNVSVECIDGLHVTVDRKAANQAPTAVLIENAHYGGEVCTSTTGYRFKYFRLSHSYLRHPLKNSRGAHAAAYAHGDHAIAAVTPFKLAQDTGGKLRAGATQRVAQCDRATVDVNFLRVETKRFD